MCTVSNNELDFVPLEAPYLCIEANEALGCSRIKSEGIRLKAEHAIPPLEDRMATYSLEDSVGISGALYSFDLNSWTQNTHGLVQARQLALAHPLVGASHFPALVS